MKKQFVLLSVLFVLNTNAQTAPKLYLNIGSHNEMNNLEPYDTNPAFFKQVRDTVKKIADMILAKGAKYNLQTCQKFIFASHTHENAVATNTDILEYCYKLGGAPFGSVIEIDPRPKTQGSYTLNMADVAHMIDSTGAQASKTVGGFLYYPYNIQDWSTYTNTINGMYGANWKADILWGAGSNPPHTHDANNYGIWKPKSHIDSANFYCHDPSQNLWVQGNGCAWVVYDTTANVQWIIKDIRNAATKIVNGTYPANKFYCATLMYNFKHIPVTQTPPIREKLRIIIDSVNNMVAQNKVAWATINQKQTAFQAWSAANSISYSQWACGQTNTLTGCTTTSVKETWNAGNLLTLSPNPANESVIVNWAGLFDNEPTLNIYNSIGQLVLNKVIRSPGEILQVLQLPNSIYTIEFSDKKTVRVIKKLVINR